MIDHLVGTKMLLPNQLKDIKQVPPFSLAVEQVKINGENRGPTEILVSYDEQGSPLLSLGEIFPSTMSALNCEIQVRYKADSDPWPILITKREFNPEQNKPIVEARLSREPLVLIDKSDSKKFEAALISAPRFLKNPILLIDKNGNKFEIKPSKSAEGATCFIRSDLHLNAKDPLKPLAPFINFLTFAKGCHCGLGNLFAYAENDSIAFRSLGFSRNDQGKRETNWFDIEIQKDLPEIFSQFSLASAEEKTNKALHQTINFYRASNVSRTTSIEMSIIAAHSALEAIVNFILTYRAGWSKAMMNNRTIAFSDKNRAAAQHFGIDSDLLSRSPELAKFSKNNSDIDVFEIISRFRNKLVHQDTRNSPTGLQLHETWLIAQWMVEVFIFGVIGYRGTIIDRRIYNGWRGTTCQIPLSRY
ncbi:hypothetical protein [Leisingera sp. ANG-S5]|uniref:hypothetical protein n=1 Tax=Leisingera sp. ANG-S5 TaxID=1577901 RepID=UPI0019D3F76A|nr:hypothetical protein [Leisingera sp. ANG-S5]